MFIAAQLYLLELFRECCFREGHAPKALRIGCLGAFCVGLGAPSLRQSSKHPPSRAIASGGC